MDGASRKTSSTGGSFSSLKRGTAAALPLIIFNFDAAKAAVQKTFNGSTTLQFRRFFSSPLFDRLAKACIQHFLARFEHDLLLKALERATLQRLVGVQQEAVRARLGELRAEAEAQLDAMAPAYALTLLQHATPRQQHQDALFFSALHEAMIGMVAEAFPRRPLAEVEARVGELLCTPAFNLYGRRKLIFCVLFRHALGRPVDALSLSDLCDLRRGMDTSKSSSLDRARLLSSLRKKPDFINVQVACQTNTGLIARFIGSPEVARAAGLAAALAAKQAARRKISAPFALPNAMLDSTTAGSVHIDRAGMISDGAVAELAQLRRVLAGKEPLLEGGRRRQGSALSMLRAGSVMSSGSSRPGSSRATLVHA